MAIRSKIIFLMGPTSSGKTALAIALRQKLPVELISVDSALIYRGMNIGTAKPSRDELSYAPHRLLDIRDPSEIYSVGDFRRDVLVEIADITSKGKIPLLVGGTMLYFKILLEGLSPLPKTVPGIREKLKKMASEKGWEVLHHQLCKIDPVAGSRIHPNDFQRISRALEVFFISGKTLTQLMKTTGEGLSHNVIQFAISTANRTFLHQRIAFRFKKMLEKGFESEARALFERGDLHADLPSIRCVGYRQIWPYFEGKIDYNEMVYRGICATRQLAKHQLTWLRGWQNVYWLDGEYQNQALNKVLQVLGANLE